MVGEHILSWHEKNVMVFNDEILSEDQEKENRQQPQTLTRNHNAFYISKRLKNWWHPELGMCKNE